MNFSTKKDKFDKLLYRLMFQIQINSSRIPKSIFLWKTEKWIHRAIKVLSKSKNVMLITLTILIIKIKYRIFPRSSLVFKKNGISF